MRGHRLAAVVPLSCALFVACERPDSFETPLSTERPLAILSAEPATASLSGGMTAGTQNVLANNSGRKLTLGTGGTASYVLATTFAETRNAEATDPSVCTVSPSSADRSALLAKLVDDFAGGRHLYIEIDRRALGGTSSSHHIGTTWIPSSGQLFTITVTGAVVTVDGTGNVFTFTGGLVKVKDRTGQLKYHKTLTCVNHDPVQVTVDGI